MCNLSIASQIFRALMGLLLVLAAWYGPQTDILSPDQKHFWWLGWIGIIPLLSGIAAFCPLYAVFGRGHRQHKKP